MGRADPGAVRARPDGMANPALATGEIEVAAAALEVLNRAETPPFVIEDRIEADEQLRLQYRYLDLRRPEMTRILRLRADVNRIMREHMDGLGFLEVETPILTRSTPEGARDFLVPSRMFPGTFYALPQSPQQLKQLLMVGGQDRYYQIVRCLRDETDDRRPGPRVHAARRRDVLRRRGRSLRRDRAPVRADHRGDPGRRGAHALPAHDVRRDARPLRLGQARPPLRHGARRR